MYNHYIRLDGNKIIKGFSTAFEQPTKDDILVAEDAQRHFELNGQTNPPLQNDEGIPLYKHEKGKVVSRTKTEIEADRKALPEPEPSETEKLKARVEELETKLQPEVEKLRVELDATRAKLKEKKIIEDDTAESR